MGRAVAGLTVILAMLLIAPGCGSEGGTPQWDSWQPLNLINVSDPAPAYGEDVTFVVHWPADLGELAISWDFGGLAPNVGPVQATSPYVTKFTVGDFGEEGPRSFTCTATLTDSKGRTASASTMITAVPVGYGD